MAKECPGCGAIIVGGYRSRKYCGDACRDRFLNARKYRARKGIPQRLKATRICGQCRTTFHPFNTTPRQTFCSRQCWRAAMMALRTITVSGYVRIRVPRRTTGADITGRMLEHRWVMQQALGRPLTIWETVHHINGVRHDNRLENLQLRNGRHGSGAAWQCVDCGSHNIVATTLL